MNLELPLEQPAKAQRPFTVQEVVAGARQYLEQLPTVWVEGEISGFRVYRSGVWFFTLKDRVAQLSCVVFRREAERMRSQPEDGLKVYAQGHLSVNAQRGQMQFVVNRLVPTSQGGFHAIKLEQARAALEKDGLLAPERKRALPRFPRCIGVVTSPDGAAWSDVVAVVRRRWPGCELVLVAARVQGEEAPREIRRALAQAQRFAGFDLLIVGRGGGSKEDLWAFNDEGVARAVAAARVPVISAVGHEVDVTLTDLVADVRAPTPSAAAEKAVPDRADVLRQLASLRVHLGRSAGRRVETAGGRLSRAALRMGAAVEHRVVVASHFVATAAGRMRAACDARAATHRGRLERLATALEALSPLAVLARGYAVARDGSGRVLRRTGDFPPGARFRLHVSDGEVPARAEAP